MTKPTVKMWVWTPTLRDEFRKSKEEIISRVKEGVTMYDINKMHVSPVTGASQELAC